MNPHGNRSWGQTLVLAVLLPAGLGLAAPNDSARQALDKQTPAKTQPADEDYVIGPEDLLVINVWREPEISRTVPVRPDGKISLPLVGEVEASGLTPLELQAKITKGLEEYLSNPEVTVIVQDVNSQRFNVVGEVLRPGSFSLAQPITVLDAIALAGGFSEWANTKKIYVLRRRPDGSRLLLRFNYKEVIKGKKFDQNVELEPGDTIVVP